MRHALDRARDILDKIETMSEPDLGRLSGMAQHAAALAAVDAAQSAKISAFVDVLTLDADTNAVILRPAERALVVRNLRALLGLGPMPGA